MEHIILVVEDDINILNIIKYNLVKENYKVLTAIDGEEGYKIAMKKKPDLILLDIMMPKMDGLEVCKKIRKVHDTPIIMLTAKAEEVDKVLGLDLGADDYITKPFSILELKARIKANLRRQKGTNNIQIEKEDKKDTIGELYRDLVIDKNNLVVTRGDEVIELTNREIELLLYLIEKKGAVVKREELLKKVWEYEYIGDIRTVDVAIRRLRVKLEKNSGDKRYIKTKRSLGYYFDLS